jgi:hypothetical protein
MLTFRDLKFRQALNWIFPSLDIVAPRIVPFSFGDEPLEAGTHATLQCSADMVYMVQK